MESPKILAAREALSLVRSGMRVGLGTGTTANEFVKLLGEELATGRLKDVRCTSTSEQTASLAKMLNIPIYKLADVAPLDLAVDGADEIDRQLRLIKGRGGALLREKIVEQQATRFVVIADDSKLVERLGTGPLPVEVTPFALDVLQARFTELDFQPVLRMRDGMPRVTDEGHRILDLRVPQDRDIADFVAELRSYAGVIDTGFFPHEATEAIIAGPDGIRLIPRPVSSRRLFAR
jgi:ribose 5-phosphate isomerase A